MCWVRTGWPPACSPPTSGPGPVRVGDDGSMVVKGRHESDWPLAGRVAELERLSRLIAAPDCSGGMIAGAAGGGETRLAVEGLRLGEAVGLATGRGAGTRAAA